MQQLIDLIERLADVLENLNLPHAFGGALANNYWGIVRATQDVDCLVAIPGLQYQRFADELADAGFVQRDGQGKDQPVSVAALRQQERERKVIELFWRGTRVELFVPAVPLQQEVLRRAVRMSFGNRTIAVTTAEDLILLKMSFHRDKDLIDVRGILWVQRGKLDLAYIGTWSQRMLADPVHSELDELIRSYSESGT